MWICLQDRNKQCEQFFEECLAILDAKGADYLKDGDALKQFIAEANGLNISPLQVLHVYMAKHWDAFTNYCAGNQMQGEGIDAKLHDIANYAAIASVLIKVIDENTGVTTEV